MISKDETKGRPKQAAAAATGNTKLKHEGKIDEAAGKTKRAVDKTAAKAKNALKK